MKKVKKPFFVSVCGVDGVGKTTLVRTLAERYCDNRYFFIARGPGDCERTVEKTVSRHYHDWRDWVAGPFAEALAIACALDYTIYYNRVIAPIFDEEIGKLHGLTHPEVVISDRHALCFKAYALCNETPSRQALQILDSIPPPDLVLYVTLPVDAIISRRSAAEPVDEFEHVEAQRKQLSAYEKVFSAIACPVIRVENSTSIEQSCVTMMDHIQRTRWKN